MAIKIKPSKRGTLHDALGVPRDEKIPASKLNIKSGDSPALKKKKQFAINAKKWNKGQSGLTVQDSYSEPSISEEDRIAKPLIDDILQPKKEDEMDVEANATYERSNKKFQKQYDKNLGRAIIQHGTDEEKNTYRDFYKNKYNQDLFNKNDLSGTLASIIAEVNALIPLDKPENPVVRPLLSYNPYSQGTGSQAIAKNGITLSTMGYKNNSKDKNKKALRIPTNNITMDGVPHPVLGVDNLGYQQLMMPNEDYEFPGTYVDEFPLKGRGGFHMMPDGTMMSNDEMKKGGKISPTKARKILHDGEVRGHKLTDKQRRFFGAMSNAQSGGVFTSQEELNAANAYALDLSKRKGLIPGRVAGKLGDPKPFFISDGLPQGVTKPKLFNVPNNITRQDIQTHGGLAWYTDPTTGDVVDIDMSVLNQPRFKISDQQVQKDSAQRTAILATNKSFKHGGSIKPLTTDTIQFNGPSHNNGGMDIMYANQGVEVEGGETGYISPVDGSLNVMGNMINPLTNRKFKEDSKRIAKKEQKIDKLIDYSTDLVLDNNPMDKWGTLAFNSGRVQMEGAAMKKAELTRSKEQLSNIQKAMLEFAQENNLDPEAFSKGIEKEAKCGMKIKAQAGTTLYNEQLRRMAEQEGIDPDILQKLVNVESGFNPTAVSNKNARGIMQMIPETAKQYGISKSQLTSSNPLDVQAVMKAGVTHFKSLLDKNNGDYKLALAAYNGGQGAVDFVKKKLGKKNITGDDWVNFMSERRTKAPTDKKHAWQNETLDYVSSITGNTSGEDFRFKYYEDPYTFNPDKPKTFGDPTYDPQTVTPADYDLGITTPRAYNRPTNAKGLSFNQIAPEIYAAATNQVEPVFMQQYTPELYQPYQVSFQDQLNENQAIFNALSKSNRGNPAVQSTLAGQAYQANQGVLANEFRTNQAIEQDIVNKNISLLNDAELKNLQLADTQYIRQSQAKSNTKAVNQQVLNSISDKLHLNELENRTLQVYENMYPNFYYDADNNYKQSFTGPKGQEMINWGTQATPQQSDAQISVRSDNQGKVTTTKRYPSNLQQQLQTIRLQNAKFNHTKSYMDWLKNNR